MLISRIRRRLYRLLGMQADQPKMVRTVSRDFMGDESGVTRRSYKSYGEYLAHQVEKADVYEAPIRKHDEEYESIVFERFQNRGLAGRSILCLGARFGGEVRAFTRLGALAIGVDLNPGANNLYVVPGDVHSLQFADGAFDVVYTNILDHIFDPEKFFREIKRVSGRGATIYFEVNLEKPTRYESLDISDREATLALIGKHFIVRSVVPVTNKTSYVNWDGELIECAVD